MSKSASLEIKVTTQANPQNLNKFFDECDKLIKQYHQLATGLQCEWLKSYRKMVESAIEFQKDFVSKSNRDSPINETFQKALYESAEAASKILATQNHIMTNMIETARQSLKTVNDNYDGITNLNSTIIQSWMSFWNPK